MFAHYDQLLTNELTESGSGLDRPNPIDIERFSTRQQSGGLVTVGGDGEPRDLMFVAVNRATVRVDMCGSIPMVTDMISPSFKRVESPRRTLLMRLVKAFLEPHLDTGSDRLTLRSKTNPTSGQQALRASTNQNH